MAKTSWRDTADVLHPTIFFSSQHFYMVATAGPNNPFGPTGTLRSSVSSLRERLVRFNYMALSLATVITAGEQPWLFQKPVQQTCIDAGQRSITSKISSHSYGVSYAYISSSNSA